jgi:hypothetical protein
MRNRSNAEAIRASLGVKGEELPKVMYRLMEAEPQRLFDLQDHGSLDSQTYLDRRPLPAWSRRNKFESPFVVEGVVPVLEQGQNPSPAYTNG